MDKLVNINRSRVYEQIVQQVCDKKKYGESGKTLFPTIREFLSFCALLGFSQDKRIPLDKSQGVEDIAGAQYINNEAEEIVYIIASLSEKSFSILEEGNELKAAKIFEEYVNGGLEIIQGWASDSDEDFLDIIETNLDKLGYLNAEA
tara:strand:- start:23 stop:463 length:441 start_codon:yes stop_codon:yes gene_type:complete